MSGEVFEFEDIGPPAHDAHVQLFRGFDLTAADPFFCPEMAMCPFCDALWPNRINDDRLLLTEEWRHDRFVHFVCCVSCGARGPCERKESWAVEAWNVVGGAYSQSLANRTHPRER